MKELKKHIKAAFDDTDKDRQVGWWFKMETLRPELEERMNLEPGALKDHERSILQACNSYVMARVEKQRLAGVEQRCHTCKKVPPSDSIKFKLCSRCKSVRYCSRKCQKKDWRKHKKVCKCPQDDDQEIIELSEAWDTEDKEFNPRKPNVPLLKLFEMAMLNRHYLKNGKCLGRARLTINRGKMSEMPHMVCSAYNMVRREDGAWVCNELTKCGTPGCNQLCTPGEQVSLKDIARLFCNENGELYFASCILRVYYEADDGGEPWMRVWGFLTHGQEPSSNPLISLQPKLVTEQSCNTDADGSLLPPEKRTEYMG